MPAVPPTSLVEPSSESFSLEHAMAKTAITPMQHPVLFFMLLLIADPSGAAQETALSPQA